VLSSASKGCNGAGSKYSDLPASDIRFRYRTATQAGQRNDPTPRQAAILWAGPVFMDVRFMFFAVFLRAGSLPWPLLELDL
jgi:hypothetical protein